ncbi:beta-defensin 126 [Suricata suricatta]|uniref:Beta-defensin n=1 Tax=Suricata suricatta TaxID=37032 RepID=A0A673UQ63_SURSU|nr:beta-defensin 126 [Suricata suricatta]
MKSLLLTLVIFFLLAQLVSGNFFLRKCGKKMGYCRKKCKNGEIHIDYLKWKCYRHKVCCVPAIYKITPLSASNKISVQTVKNQELSTTKKLQTTLMVITASTI